MPGIGPVTARPHAPGEVDTVDAAPPPPPPPPPVTPAASPTNGDCFGDPPQVERGRQFGAFAAGGPAAPSDADVRERMRTSIDRGLAAVPGMSPEQRVAARDQILTGVETTARALGLPLSAVRKVEVSFNVNGSVVNGGLSGALYPESERGNFSFSLGVGTPTVPGASASLVVGFNTGAALLGEGTALNGRVTFPSPVGMLTVKGGTDGGISVERDLAGFGGGPGVGVEVNVPASEALATARNLAERLTGTDRISMTRQANQITGDAMARAEAEYRQAQARINRRYDDEIRADPSRAPGANEARGRDLAELQRSQIRTYEALRELDQRMQAEIARRFAGRRN